MRCTPNEAHAYEVHAHEVHTHEVHTREVHAYEVHTREVHAYEYACEMHVYEVHTRCTPVRHIPHETHAREMHAYEMHAHEVYPHKTKLVDLDCDSQQSAGYYSQSAKLSIRRPASLLLWRGRLMHWMRVQGI
jgi:hypothetical protein